MGYTTEFDGEFAFNKPLDFETHKLLTELAETKRLQWVPTSDGEYLIWDGSEKFYNYVEWLQYLIEKIFSPRGYLLSGEVYWQGEDYLDMGKITLVDNILQVSRGRVVYD